MALSLAEKFTFFILLVLIAVVELLPAPGGADFRLIRTLIIFTPLFLLLLYPFGVLRKTEKQLRHEVGKSVSRKRWAFIHSLMKLERRSVIAFAVFFASFVFKTLTTAGAGAEVVFTPPHWLDVTMSILLLGSAISFILTKVAYAHETSKFREFSFGSSKKESGAEGPWKQFLDRR